MNNWQSLWHSAREMWQEGMRLEAIEAIQHAFALALEDRVLAAFAIGCEAVEMLALANRTEDARAFAARLSELAEGVDEPWAQCNAFLSFGNLLRGLGERAEARKWLARAAQIAETLPDPHTQCIAFGSFGDLLSGLGEMAEARKWLARAAQIAETLPDPHTQCIAFGSFGDLLSGLGEMAEARKWLARAAQIAETLPDPHTQCIAFGSFGDLLRGLGEMAEARKWLARAAQIAETLPDPHTQCNAFLSFGNLLRGLGERAEARKWLARAAQIAETLPDPHTQCIAFRSFGDLLSGLGEMAEARKWLARALALIGPDSEPVLVCNVHRSFGELENAERQWVNARRHSKTASDAVFRWLASTRSARSAGQIMQSYDRIFEIGIRSLDADRERADSSDDPVYFGDGGKTIALRERMRRRRRHDREFPVWRPSGGSVEHLFQPLPHEMSHVGVQRRRLRGLRRGEIGDSQLDDWLNVMLSETHAADDDEPPSTEYTKAATLTDCARLLPDPETVIILSMAAEGDLLYLPIRLVEHDPDVPKVLRTKDGRFFRVVDGVARAHQMEMVVNSVLEVAQDALEYFPRTSVAKRFSLKDADFGEVNLSDLQLEEPLAVIEPDAAKRAGLRVVFIPDGPLYRLPLHAIMCSDGRYLYEQVESFRYALSISTLLLQQDIDNERTQEERADRRLRGVAFGCPALSISPLPGVQRETEILVEQAPDSWWIHGNAKPANQQSLLRRFEERHGSGNVVVNMGHGLCGGKYLRKVGDRSEVIEVPPSFIMEDGLLGLAQVAGVAIDFSHVLLVYFSSCLLGRIEGVGGGELEGFIAALAQQGARRVLSALWPLADDVAPEFTRHLVKALLDRYFNASNPDRHAFALAYKDAIDAFRKADPKHDHPYFWAPYVLYGLG